MFCFDNPSHECLKVFYWFYIGWFVTWCIETNFSDENANKWSGCEHEKLNLTEM